MERNRTWLVKEVARLTGLSIRALHHYDEIGLVAPAGRTAAGYRLYNDDDLLRLQQVVIGRALGLSLDDIRRALDERGFDRRAALLEQRARLRARQEEAEAMLAAVDAALRLLDQPETTMGNDEMKTLFDGFDPAAHEPEAEQRWGDTEAWKVSKARTKTYGQKEWAAIKAEQEAVYEDAAAAMRAGKKPTDDDVMDIADRHRFCIDRWFYPCSITMHRGLADLWENDPRFAANIDRYGAGLTAFLAAAVRANALRHTPGG